jgi:hypothetical protein
VARTLYVLREAEGLRLLDPAQPLTTLRKRVSSIGEAEAEGAPIGGVVDYEVNHFPGWSASYGPDDLARFLIVAVEADDTAPEGQQLAGFDLEEAEGEVVATARFEPLPPAPRRLIRKSEVQERVHGLGKLDDAFSYMMGEPLLFLRWTAADRPQVYADDGGLLQVLNGIGCTEAEIAAITAP